MGKNKKNIKYKDYKKQLDKKKQIYEKRAVASIEILAPMFFLGVAAVYPLFVWKSKYIDITYEKTLFLWVFTALFAGFLAIALILKKCLNQSAAPAGPKPPAGISVAQWALVAFLGFALLSALTSARLPWGENVKEVVWFGFPERHEGFISFLCYGVAFFIIAKFYKPKRWHLFVLAASALLVSLYGVLQFMGIDIFGLFPFHIEELATYGPLSAYFRTTLGNINIASAYCTFAVVLFAVLFAVSDTFFKWDALYLAASSVSFALMLISRGDASNVAVAGAMVLLMPYWLSDRQKFGKALIALAGWCAAYVGFNAYLSSQKKLYELDNTVYAVRDRRFLQGYVPVDIKFFIVAALVLLAAGLFLVMILEKWPKRAMKIAGIAILPAALISGLLFVEFVAARWADDPGNILWQLREIMHGNFDDKFGTNRGWVWKRGFSVLFDRPIFGSGPDTFYYALGEDLQKEASALYRIYFDKAHNIFLQVAVCMGIPALFSYLAFLGGLFVSAAKRAFENPLVLAFGAAAASYTIQSFFCVEVPITTPLVWVCFGVVAGEIARGDKKS